MPVIAVQHLGREVQPWQRLQYRAGEKGVLLAFGLAAAALWPGTLAGQLISLTGAWNSALILVSFAAGLAAIIYAEKKLSEVPV